MNTKNARDLCESFLKVIDSVECSLNGIIHYKVRLKYKDLESNGSGRLTIVASPESFQVGARGYHPNNERNRYDRVSLASNEVRKYLIDITSNFIEKAFSMAGA